MYKQVHIIGDGVAGQTQAIELAKRGCQVKLFGTSESLGSAYLDAIRAKIYWSVSQNLPKESESSLQETYRQLIQMSNERLQNIILPELQQIESYMMLGNISYFKGRAYIGPDQETWFSGENIGSPDFTIIATGDSQAVPQNSSMHHPLAKSYHYFSEFEEFPSKIFVYGTGIIGSEYASILSTIGAEVVGLNPYKKFFHREPDEIKNRIFVAAGYSSIVNGFNAENLQFHADSLQYEDYTAQYCLMANGRKPNSQDLVYSRLGVRYNKRGYIENCDCQTDNPRIYVIGNVRADSSGLINSAKQDACHVAQSIQGEKSTLKKSFPWTVFLSKPWSGIGETTDNAYSFEMNSQQSITGEHADVVLYTDNGIVSGIRTFSTDLNLIHILSQFYNKPLDDFLDTVFAEPSLLAACRDHIRLLCRK